MSNRNNLLGYVTTWRCLLNSVRKYILDFIRNILKFRLQLRTTCTSPSASVCRRHAYFTSWTHNKFVIAFFNPNPLARSIFNYLLQPQWLSIPERQDLRFVHSLSIAWRNRCRELNPVFLTGDITQYILGLPIALSKIRRIRWEIILGPQCTHDDLRGEPKV